MEVLHNNLLLKHPQFNGLWGYKTYCKKPVFLDGVKSGYINQLPRILELNQIDRFYPFADDTKEIIEEEIKQALEFGVKDYEEEIIPFSEDGVIMQEVLPFTRAEYLAYKAKDVQSRNAYLSDVDKDIEYFLGMTMRGLTSYKNRYMPPKSTTLCEKIKQVLSKTIIF